MIRTGGGLRKQLESDDNDLLREVGAEAYLRGVSPRRVEGLVEALHALDLRQAKQERFIVLLIPRYELVSAAVKKPER